MHVNTPSQSEGEHLTGSCAPTQSEDQRVDREWWYSQAILSNRGEGQARADSQHTRSCQEESGKPPKADRASVRAGRSCAQASDVALSREGATSRVSGMATLWTSVCTTNTFVAGEGRRSVRNWASPLSP